MKITRLETLRAPPSWVWLKLHTDEGLVGLDAEGCVAVPTGPGLGVEIDEEGMASISARPWSQQRG